MGARGGAAAGGDRRRICACVTWKDTHIDYQNAVVMAFVSEEGLVDVEMDSVLDGVTHWMPLPAPPEEM